MFLPENLATLSTFCGVKARPEFAQKRFNHSEQKSSLPDGLAKDIAAEYKHVYEFCGELFPETKNLWGGFKYL